MIAAYTAVGIASTARVTHPDLEGLQVSLS